MAGNGKTGSGSGRSSLKSTILRRVSLCPCPFSPPWINWPLTKLSKAGLSPLSRGHGGGRSGSTGGSIPRPSFRRHWRESGLSSPWGPGRRCWSGSTAGRPDPSTGSTNISPSPVPPGRGMCTTFTRSATRAMASAGRVRAPWVPMRSRCPIPRRPRSR